jgi:lipopolysaccharide transport system ATP-binding protein
MSEIVIRADALGKMYRIGHVRERYKSLRDSIAKAAAAPYRRLRVALSPAFKHRDIGFDEYWALRDVSFEIKRGEVVGVIGKNGAGKSTLLRILSRITDPTEGRAEMHGRVASLLEVGAGFHPELTGRENVYLSASILGMKRAEINKKFDQIVEFAQVSQFIDTPVKHFSSGMYLRLAFSVAAHLEPEILLVDEVLAVGDAAFQQKCLGKMGEVAQGGRTVFLVSHTMSAISSLCTACMLFDAGKLTCFGSPDKVVDRYLRSLTDGSTEVALAPGEKRRGSGQYRFTRASFHDASGSPTNSFEFNDEIRFRFGIEGRPGRAHSLFCVVMVRTGSGVPILCLMSEPNMAWPLAAKINGECLLPSCPLYPGNYIVSYWLGRDPNHEIDWVPDALSFQVRPGKLNSYGFDLSWRVGVVHCESVWSAESVELGDTPVSAVSHNSCES